MKKGYNRLTFVEMSGKLKQEKLECLSMANDSNDPSEEESQAEEAIFEKELDTEALDVIKRLYDKTFKDLVNR